MKLFKHLTLTALFVFSIIQLEAQVLTPAELIDAELNRGTHFEQLHALSTANEPIELPEAFSRQNNKYDLLDINRDQLEGILEKAPSNLSMNIPSQSRDKNFQLLLVKSKVFTPDFNVIQASDRTMADVEHGVHYQGIIRDDPYSLVAISIYENEIMGFISTDAENLVIGKLSGQNNPGTHILYNDKTVFESLPFECSTKDDGIGYKSKDLDYTGSLRDVGDCIRLYIEVDHDIYNDKGGLQGTSDYITGLLNQVITLYNNENLAAAVSEMVIWDVTSPYSSTQSSGMLSDFQANTGSFNGDLAQLLSYQASGGIAAGFSGICNSNPDNSKCFSSIQSTYATVPTYSWSVMVVTHEFGHLWGSRHTHACVWNGNNTAIDGCAGSTEGNCPLPGNPSDGGTIMSYCHLTSVGINFNKGFGPQPGDVIRNSVANANCTSTCGPPSCSDGIQNGEETGIDCGGPDCDPCPTCSDGIQNGEELGVDCGGPDCDPCPCDGQDVTLTLVLDNYPEETSWEITAGGLIYASGGPYDSEPDGATVIEVHCLNDGCYDFTIYDSYGDGICCSYGNGSYTLEDADGTVLASGGSFGSSETTNFCISTAPPPLDVSISSSSNESCAGIADGSATASASGGTSPYSYAWSNGANGASISGLSAGSYTVTASDADNNTATAVAVIEAEIIPGDSCDDNDACTVNDTYDSNCNCSGTFADADGDGVCDANDVCPGHDDNVDSDGDGIPDGCDDTECIQVINSFPVDPLTHSGSGSSSTTLQYSNPHQDVNFSINNLGSKTNGNPNNRYIDLVTVEYVDGSGTTQNYGTFSGENTGTVNVTLPGNVQSVTLSLEDGYDGNANNLSVNPSSVSSCDPDGSCSDSDGDGVCDVNDVCPGFDDNVDSDGDGIPDGCDNDCNTEVNSFPQDPLTHSGSGTSSTTLDFGGVAHQDVTLNISNLGSKTNGNPNNRYIDLVTVEYVDNNNTTQTYGSFSGENVNNVDITLPGMIQSVTLILEDGYDGNANNLSVNPSDVSSCIPAALDEGYDREHSIDAFNIYPNPTQDYLNIAFRLTGDTQFDYTLTSLDGQTVAMESHVLKTGYRSIKINVRDLSSGMYIIHAVTKDDRIVRRVIIAR